MWPETAFKPAERWEYFHLNPPFNCLLYTTEIDFSQLTQVDPAHGSYRCLTNAYISVGSVSSATRIVKYIQFMRHKQEEKNRSSAL